MAAAGAAHLTTTPLAAAASRAAEPCDPTPPGVRTAAIALTPSGRTVWSTDTSGTTITPHRRRTLMRGRPVEVGGAPNGIAVSPSGALALVTTAFYDRPGLALVDLRTRQADRVDVGPEPYAVAFRPDGRRAYVAGGGPDGGLTALEPRRGDAEDPIPLGAHPRGIAVHPDGEHVLVALNGAGEVAVVSLERRRVVRRIATPAFPYLLAISSDGRRALVTHSGLGARAATPLDLIRWRARRPIRVGSDPAGVAFAGSGPVAVVAAAGSGLAAVVDVRSRRRLWQIATGGAPRAVAATPGRVLVADGATGRLQAFRVAAQ